MEEKTSLVALRHKRHSLITFLWICIQKGVTGFKMVMAHSTMLCKIDSIELKNTGTRFYRKDEINIVKICISEVPSDRKESLCIENIELKEGNPWSHDFVKLCN
ncbi:phospholipase A1 member A-like [Acipenser ruthenus]|uniref:phospholipase A1 member A-like n=1 Tax=Acipenser ruthenus TaxID=7906 RepID=UPI0027415064|nr:phospholipase A1 member A-like [Acipenser ruthenus]